MEAIKKKMQALKDECETATKHAEEAETKLTAAEKKAEAAEKERSELETKIKALEDKLTQAETRAQEVFVGVARFGKLLCKFLIRFDSIIN